MTGDSRKVQDMEFRGRFPSRSRGRIEHIGSADDLDGYLDRVLLAESLQDMKLDA